MNIQRAPHIQDTSNEGLLCLIEAYTACGFNVCVLNPVVSAACSLKLNISLGATQLEGIPVDMLRLGVFKETFGEWIINVWVRTAGTFKFLDKTDEAVRERM